MCPMDRTARAAAVPGFITQTLELRGGVGDLDRYEHPFAIEPLRPWRLGEVIGSHEGDTEAVIPCGGEINEPRRFEYHRKLKQRT
jgi:hypothetical protein